MRARFNTLAVKQARNAVIVACCLGLIFSAAQIASDLHTERQTLNLSIQRILNSLSAPATRAVFNVDAELAQNVVDSLLEYVPIHSATVIDDFDGILATRSKQVSSDEESYWSKLLVAPKEVYRLPLKLEDGGQPLGEIQVTVDSRVIIGNFMQRSMLIVVFGLVRNFILAFMLAFVFHMTMTRPLVALAKRVSNTDPANPGDKVIDVEQSHRDDELGELTAKINEYIATTEEQIKERRIAEQKALQSERQFRDFAEASSDWFWEVDPQLNFTFVSEQVKPRVGVREAKDFVGSSLNDVIDEFFPNHGRQPVLDAIAEGEPIRNSVALSLDSEGNKSWISASGVPVFDEAGNYICFRASSTDVTDQHLAAEALKISEAKYRTIFDSAQVGIMRNRLDTGRVIDANQRAAEILGYDDVDDMIANHDAAKSWVHPEERTRIHAEGIKNGFVRDLEQALYRKDGSVAWINSSANFPPKENLVDVLFVDVSRRKAAESELERLNTELEQRVRERTAELREAQANLIRQERLATLGQLTATVSHELRNPLGAMGTSAYVVRHAVADNEKAMRAVERIERAVARCDRIIDEILDYTRIRELNMEPRPLDKWLGEVIAEQSLPPEIELVLELSTRGAVVEFDPEYLRRAVINVYENAIQAMTMMEGIEKPDKRRLTVSTQLHGENVEIRIEDSGVGIDSEVKDQIFEPMFSTKGFGVGLGLTVVRQIVEQHGGSTTVDGQVGRGTIVTIVLPLSQCGSEGKDHPHGNEVEVS